MERPPSTFDPTECKHAIRHVNGTNLLNLMLLITVTPYSKTTPPRN